MSLYGTQIEKKIQILYLALARKPIYYSMGSKNDFHSFVSQTNQCRGAVPDNPLPFAVVADVPTHAAVPAGRRHD